MGAYGMRGANIVCPADASKSGCMGGMGFWVCSPWGKYNLTHINPYKKHTRPHYNIGACQWLREYIPIPPLLNGLNVAKCIL